MANEIATAARTTLASGSARVWHRTFFLPPAPRIGRFASTQEGVADLVERRTRTELGGPSIFDEWAARLLARFPWLDDDEDHDRSGPVVVYAGSAKFFSIGRRWETGDGGAVGAARDSMDPLWIVEVLVHADEAVARGDDVVRGAACRRWQFRADPALYEGAGGSERRPRRVAGDAWIDRDGRLRRVTWTELRAHRPRSPVKPRPGSRLWQTTELWDFGVPVDIEVPSVERAQPSSPWPVGLIEVAWKLWRRKRAYERRHPEARAPD